MLTPPLHMVTPLLQMLTPPLHMLTPFRRMGMGMVTGIVITDRGTIPATGPMVITLAEGIMDAGGRGHGHVL
jgi:hypothetical protein